MIYDNSRFEFFGLDSDAIGECINATRLDRDIALDIGLLQSVEIGSIYNVITDGDVPGDERTTRIEVTSVKRFRSRARPLDANALESWPSKVVRRATLHRWAMFISLKGSQSLWNLNCLRHVVLF
ncbi:hypothetical protein FOTG_11371 [Fusarium oxysporum f. sp. vasinfectum 25433]|uniref:Uncharacterized protein n=1 Tax=Fusarium oxysporum f. sp. vasinfectum 25433 TaxID=1089449 RepID=X0L450_FUSOX|nr:hypothetical protein FOTG_11371 [Fusarium oxysporum f. sp. vasinfectum 25433]